MKFNRVGKLQAKAYLQDLEQSTSFYNRRFKELQNTREEVVSKLTVVTELSDVKLLLELLSCIDELNGQYKIYIQENQEKTNKIVAGI